MHMLYEYACMRQPKASLPASYLVLTICMACWYVCTILRWRDMALSSEYHTLSYSLYLSLLSSYVHREGREVKSQKDGGEKKKLLFCCQEEETA